MWNTLGIEPTSDIKKIKSAYARLAKKYNPEEHPDEFRKVFDAYKAAVQYADRQTENTENSGFVPHSERTNGSKTFRTVFRSDGSSENKENKSEEFDFAFVDGNYLVSEDDYSDEYLKTYLRRLYYIASLKEEEKKYELFEKLYSEKDFSKATADEHFRVRAHLFFRTHNFDKKSAELTARIFGKGSHVCCDGLFQGGYRKVWISAEKKYMVYIMKEMMKQRRGTSAVISNKPRNIKPLEAIIVILIFVFTMIVLPVYMIMN